MMNKLALGLLAMMILNTSSLSLSQSIASSNEDQKQGNWYDNSISYFENSSSINLDNYLSKLEPNKEVKRKEIVTLLKKVSDGIVNTEEVIIPKSPFKDIPEDEDIKGSIDWAYENLITNGIDVNQFGSDNNVTREEAVTFIYRISKILKLNLNDVSEKGIDRFSDYDNSSIFAREAIEWAINKKIIEGYEDKIYPKNNITQAEMLQILYNTLNNLNKNKEQTFTLNLKIEDIQNITLISSDFKKIKIDEEKTEDFLKDLEALKFSKVESVENRKANPLMVEVTLKENSNKLSYSFFESFVNCGSYKYIISKESSEQLKKLINKWDSMEVEDLKKNQGKLNK